MLTEITYRKSQDILPLFDMIATPNVIITTFSDFVTGNSDAPISNRALFGPLRIQTTGKLWDEIGLTGAGNQLGVSRILTLKAFDINNIELGSVTKVFAPVDNSFEAYNAAAVFLGLSSTTPINAIELTSDNPNVGWDNLRFSVVPVTPFAAFTAKLEIELGHRIDDAFELQSTFTLGTGSNGIDLSKDDVTLELKHGTASFTTTIPADSFKQDKKGRFEFEGTINGVSLEATLTPRGNNAYEFKAEGKHADLTGIANPVTVTLTIGNDSGSTTVRAKFDHDDGDHGDGENRQH
jgi:hypothetical protein